MVLIFIRNALEYANDPVVDISKRLPEAGLRPIFIRTRVTTDPLERDPFNGIINFEMEITNRSGRLLRAHVLKRLRECATETDGVLL